MVNNLRKRHPRMGCRKLYATLKDEFIAHNIKIGRDRFIDLLRESNLLIKPRKKYHQTTNSRHWMRKYSNLIKDVEPLGPNHIIVSDITYWKTKNKHLYISFVTDVYSKMILGANVGDTLESIETVKALKQALKSITPQSFEMIHHSDRGVQYCSSKYVNLLKKHNIKISMTEGSDPLDNSIAERINGIIKGEYLYDYEVKSLDEARKILNSVVKLYNNERPHSSLNYMKPRDVHFGKLDREIKKMWKTYYKKQDVF